MEPDNFKPSSANGESDQERPELDSPGLFATPENQATPSQETKLEDEQSTAIDEEATKEAAEPNLPTHADTSPFSPTSPMPKSKSHSPLSWLLWVILVLAIALGLYFVFFAKADDTDKTSNKETPAAVEHSEAEITEDSEQTKLAEKIISDLKADLTNKLKVDYPSAKLTDGSGTNSYLPSGSDFAVATDEFGSSLRVELGDDMLSLVKADYLPGLIDGFFETNYADLSRSVVESKDNAETDGLNLVAYQGNGVYCAAITNGPIVSNISCAGLTQLNSYANKVKPFANLYLSANEASKGKIAFSQLIINNREEEDNKYSTATVNIQGWPLGGGFVGVYYSVDGKWKYFTGTQAMISCDAYDTHDLQAAFANDPCMNGDEETTVKVTL